MCPLLINTKRGRGEKDKKIQGGKNVLEHGGSTLNDLTTQKRGCPYETRAVGAHTQWGGGDRGRSKQQHTFVTVQRRLVKTNPKLYAQPPRACQSTVAMAGT